MQVSRKVISAVSGTLLAVAITIGGGYPQASYAKSRASKQLTVELEIAFWAAVQSREDSAHTFDWQFAAKFEDYSNRPSLRENPIDYSRLWRVTADGKKTRMEESGDPSPLDEIPIKTFSLTRIYDGSFTKTYSPASGVKYPVAYRSKGYDGLRLGFYEQVSTRPLVLCYRLHDWLSWKSLTKSALVFNQETLDGKQCVTLTYRLGPQAAWQLEGKIWFDPARDFVPVRQQDTQRTSMKTSQFEINYIRDEKYGFVPTSWIWTGRTPGKPLSKRQVNVMQWTINDPLPVDAFTLDFLPGTYVFDSDTKTEYIVRPDGSKRLVTKQEWEQGATYQSLLNSEPPRNVAPKSPKPAASKGKGDRLPAPALP